ncbi:hypothetical protein ACJMK2_014486 [Sinanodonta woodiana]|uniref:Uncharacterized protein n=1 Tax=Sinanodonta woodiana TaxID=1069815 RepID=A0ABD3V1J8_SINWO
MCRYPTFTQPSRHTDGRPHVHLESWHCHQERVWRDLGPDFYPRFITDMRCLNTTCLFGNHFCKSVNVYTKVLMKSEESSCVDVFIPSELRSKWVFQDILVSVYCECSTT